MSDITANVVVSMPSQLFTLARSFKAASNGRIYIGRINTDPTIPSNQIQVYVESESGSLIPAAQPIIINDGGFPVYNGQVSKFVAVEGHSMAVYDSYGTQQFYFPSVLKYNPDQLRSELNTEGPPTLVDDSRVGLRQPFDGALPRSQHDFNKEHISLLDFCKCDGVTDDTDGLRKAIATGVKRIKVPSSEKGIRLTSTVTLDKPVVFFGDGTEPYTAWGAPNSRGVGSWFYLDHNGVGFNLKGSVARFTGPEFHQIGTYRNQNNVASGAFNPIVQDFDFVADDCGDVKFIDVCLFNPYKGILIKNGQAGRAWIERLYGQPLAIGIQIDESYDCIRINNVQFWCYWSTDSIIWKWQLANTTALKIYRSDGLIVSNFFSIHHFIGIGVFSNSFGVATEALMTNIFLDNCTYGYYVDSSARAHSARIVNLNIQTNPDASDNSAKGILTLADNVTLDIVNPKISISKSNAISIFGAYSDIALHSPQFNQWSQVTKTDAALAVDKATSTAKVTGRVLATRQAGSTAALFGGAGTIHAEAGSGSFNANTDSFGNMKVTHNLGIIATSAQVVFRNLVPITYSWVGSDKDSFTVQVFNPTTGNALPNTPINATWRANIN